MGDEGQRVASTRRLRRQAAVTQWLTHRQRVRYTTAEATAGRIEQCRRQWQLNDCMYIHGTQAPCTAHSTVKSTCTSHAREMKRLRTQQRRANADGL